MYVPQHYRVEDQAEIFALIKNHSFGILVTSQGDLPFATHLPFMLDESRGSHGTLVSHLARANPQWRHFESGKEALVIFQGPHSYISPSWYVSEFNVPTWNYVIAHIYGAIRIVDSHSQAMEMLDRLVAQYEGTTPEAWSTPWEDERYRKLVGGIVAFEIEISRIEGKFKLSQNKSQADRLGAIEHLQESTDREQQLMGKIMDHHLKTEEEAHNV